MLPPATPRHVSRVSAALLRRSTPAAFEYSNRVRGSDQPNLAEAQAGQEPGPPPPREVLRVAEHGDGWGTPQQWEPA
jgi:hypothetical protein